MPEPTLLMVHGLAGSLEYFDPAARIAGANVHTLDLLGYGSLSDVDRDRLTLHEQAKHVASTMASLPGGPMWLLGHSMGGAVSVLVADERPELVRGIINVEGNFTLKDAFWATKITAQSLAEWSQRYRTMRDDVPTCLADWGVVRTAQRVEWLARILDHQAAETIYVMSKGIIAETGVPSFLDTVRRIIDREVPLHLIAGARTAEKWDVPDFVRDAARSYTEITHAGHLMMLEEPEAFCRTVGLILFSHGVGT